MLNTAFKCIYRFYNPRHNISEFYSVLVNAHPTTRHRGDIVTRSLCTSQWRHRCVSNETPNDSLWNVRKTSQWYVFTMSYWYVVATSHGDVMTTSHQYVSMTSKASLKWNTQCRLSGTSPRRLSGTYPRRPISTYLGRLL